MRSHRRQPIRLPRLWDSPGKNTGVGCHFLLQGIFPTQESIPGLLHCRQILNLLSYDGGHLMRRANSLEMTLLLGKIEGTRRREQQDEIWFDGITNLMGMSLSELQEVVKYREAWHAAVHGATKSCARLSTWTATTTETSNHCAVCLELLCRAVGHLRFSLLRERRTLLVV